MGLVLQKLLSGGALVELDHSFQCCNDEVHSSSSSSSVHTHATHASHHIHTARGKEIVDNTKAPCQELSSSVVEQGQLENRSDAMAGR